MIDPTLQQIGAPFHRQIIKAALRGNFATSPRCLIAALNPLMSRRSARRYGNWLLLDPALSRREARIRRRQEPLRQGTAKSQIKSKITEKLKIKRACFQF
jgi:hypothetical protein